MANIVSNILTGFRLFPFVALMLTLPIFIITYLHYHKLNFARIAVNYAMLLYFLCVAALVFLPLPDMNSALHSSSYSAQLIPFKFVADIVRESPLDIGNPASYIPAITNDAVLQVLCNIIMTIPFGMFLRYYCHRTKRSAVIFTFLLSLFIETAQLTGLFFIFPCSNRLFDIDDLMMNTFGGFLGFCMMTVIEKHIPVISHFQTCRA